MKIALITNRYFPEFIGGAEKVTQTLSEGIIKHGHELNILTFENEGKSGKEKVNGFEVHRLKLRNLYVPNRNKKSLLRKALWHSIDSSNFISARDVFTWLLKNKPDVVHTHNLSGFSPSVWQSVKRLEIPLIHTLHDYYILCPRTTMYRKSKNCEEPCLECKILSSPKVKISNHVDTVVGVSNYILEQHIKNGGFSNSRKVVIYNGINLNEPKAIENKIEVLESKPLQFGYIGKINESKGIRLLLEAFNKVPQNSADLLIAGSGNIDYTEKLKNLTKGRPNVHWLGYVEPESFYKKLDVVVVPSLWNEPFGLVAIEPMQYGIPLIISNRGGLAEIITSEQAGWCFDPDQPGSLFKILKFAIQNRNKIRSMGRKIILYADRFSSKHMINSYIKEYKRLIS